MTWLARLKNQKALDPYPTKPTKGGFVGFVGTSQPFIEKNAGAVQAANDAAPDPDRYSWPHSRAMNGQEIDTFMARLVRFMDIESDLDIAEDMADRLLMRDREGDADDRSMCLECTHLRRGWRCGNWARAGVAIRSTDAELALDFVRLLQRCDGFKPV
jgi:hypothetical protein